MENEIEFTVHNEEELTKAKKLLNLLDEMISNQIKQIQFVRNVALPPSLDCIIDCIKSNEKRIFLPKNPTSTCSSDNKFYFNYDGGVSFIILFDNTFKYNFSFIECPNLDKFKL